MTLREKIEIWMSVATVLCVAGLCVYLSLIPYMTGGDE